MPQQARHHLRQPGISFRPRRRNHSIREIRIETRGFGRIRSSAGGAAADARAGLVGDEVQRFVDVHGGWDAGTDGEVVFGGGGRGEEEVFDGGEDEEGGGGLVRVRWWWVLSTRDSSQKDR